MSNDSLSRSTSPIDSHNSGESGDHPGYRSPLSPARLSPKSKNSSSQPRSASCCACRLRRVRCAKLPGISACAACHTKGIKCVPSTQSGVRASRGGKRIEQAKELFGSESDGDDFDASLSSTQGRLVDGVLEGSLTLYLIQEHFYETNPSIAWIDQGTVEGAFERGGRRLEMADAAMAGLISALIAVGARITDHSAIAGPNAPRFEELTRTYNLSGYGGQRQRVCCTLRDRAIRHIDRGGLLRKPSAVSLACLVVMQELLQLDPEHQDAHDAYRAAAVQHLRAVLKTKLTEGERALIGRGESAYTMIWQDCTSSTSSGRTPLLNADDLEMTIGKNRPELAVVFVPSALSGMDAETAFSFIRRTIFCHLAATSRNVSFALTGYPAMCRSSLNEAALRDFFDSVNAMNAAVTTAEQYAASAIHVSSASPESVSACSLWRQAQQLRIAIAACGLTPHRIVSARLIDLPAHSGKESKSERKLTDEYGQRLHTLSLETANFALQSSRAIARVLQAMLLQPGTVEMSMLRQAASWTRPLGITPAEEEGGPSGCGWTLATKFEELSGVARAIDIASFSYVDNESTAWVHEALNSTRSALLRMNGGDGPDSTISPGMLSLASSHRGFGKGATVANSYDWLSIEHQLNSESTSSSPVFDHTSLPSFL